MQRLSHYFLRRHNSLSKNCLRHLLRTFDSSHLRFQSKAVGSRLASQERDYLETRFPKKILRNQNLGHTTLSSGYWCYRVFPRNFSQSKRSIQRIMLYWLYRLAFWAILKTWLLFFLTPSLQTHSFPYPRRLTPGSSAAEVCGSATCTQRYHNIQLKHTLELSVRSAEAELVPVAALQGHTECTGSEASPHPQQMPSLLERQLHWFLPAVHTLLYLGHIFHLMNKEWTQIQ